MEGEKKYSLLELRPVLIYIYIYNLYYCFNKSAFVLKNTANERWEKKKCITS